MIRTTITLTAALALAPAALAAPDTDYPHRDWGKIATLDMSLGDATACIARAMDREGSILVLPTEGGSDIDFSPATFLWGSTFEPYLRIKVRPVGDVAEMRVFYRHPVTVKTAGRYVEKMQKRCLKVRSIAPATE